MVASNDWKLEVGKNAQIIALTTQISELKTAFNQIKIDKSTKPHSENTPKQLCNQNDSFQMWRLTKVNNDNKFNMVEKEGKTYYWCVSTSILIVNSRECMFFISQWSMMREIKER